MSKQTKKPVATAIGAAFVGTMMVSGTATANSNPFGLILRSGRGAPTEDGDTDGSELRDLCGQCHVQGSAFAEPLPQPQARPLS